MSRSFETHLKLANVALFVEGSLDRISEFFTPDYRVHLTKTELTGGHALVRRVLSLYLKAFTEISVEVDILVRNKDRIAWQRTITARHTGAFQGFPASGQQIIWRDMITSRMEQGLIAEEWFLSDLAEQLLQSRKPTTIKSKSLR